MQTYSASKHEMKIIPHEEAPTEESIGVSGFEKLILDAIDEGLSILGDCSKDAFYSYLNKVFRIKKQDIPHKIEEFTDAIEKVFGTSAKLLEIEIMKHLYRKVEHNFEYPPEKSDLFFIEYVEAAQECTNATGKIQCCNSLLKLT